MKKYVKNKKTLSVDRYLFHLYKRIELAKTAQEMAHAGLTWRQIGKKLNKNWTTVFKWFS